MPENKFRILVSHSVECENMTELTEKDDFGKYFSILFYSLLNFFY